MEKLSPEAKSIIKSGKEYLEKNDINGFIAHVHKNLGNEKIYSSIINYFYDNGIDVISYCKSSIPALAFIHSNVSVVAIPSSVYSIGILAFHSCKNLTKVTIPSSVVKIEGDAFSSCDNLKTVTFSTGLQIIDSCAFSKCPSLNELRFPESLKIINRLVATDCNEIYLPSTLTHVDPFAFGPEPGGKIKEDLIIHCGKVSKEVLKELKISYKGHLEN